VKGDRIDIVVHDVAHHAAISSVIGEMSETHRNIHALDQQRV
jgi:hypothetical protein